MPTSSILLGRRNESSSLFGAFLSLRASAPSRFFASGASIKSAALSRSLREWRFVDQGDARREKRRALVPRTRQELSRPTGLISFN